MSCRIVLKEKNFQNFQSTIFEVNLFTIAVLLAVAIGRENVTKGSTGFQLILTKEINKFQQLREKWKPTDYVVLISFLVASNK